MHRRRAPVCVPAAVAEDCEGNFCADALDEACEQDFAAHAPPVKSHGDECCDDFAEECRTGFADEQAAEGAAEQQRRRRWGGIQVAATSAVLAAGKLRCPRSRR